MAHVEAVQQRTSGKARGVLRDGLIGVAAIAFGAASVLTFGAVRSWLADAPEAIGQANVLPLVPAAQGPGATTPRLAVQSFLEAEQNGQAGAAFALLSQRDRERYPNEATWSARRTAALGAVQTWSWTDETSEAQPSTVLKLDAGLTSTSGWSAGEMVVRWHVVDEDGWRVSLTESTVEPVLPSAEGVGAAAEQWLVDPDRCAPASATVETIGSPLLGSLLEHLCIAGGEADGGASLPVSGRLAADLGLRYGGGASTWARTVSLADGSQLVLAGIGDTRVVIDAQPRS